MSDRKARYDYAGPSISLTNAVGRPPTQDYAPAVITRDGYLSCEAYLARDGLLRYSDGQTSWLEYRSREELEKAAESWMYAPVTDGHPDRMVDATSWREVARGVHTSIPIVDGPDDEGVSRLRARLLITDAGLIQRVMDGEVLQTSIGFTANINPTPGATPDGTRYDAAQTDMSGNHTAILKLGRSGPTVRLLLDGETIPVSGIDGIMKNDEIGAPETVAMLVGPDGVEVQVPTWVASAIEELKQMKAAEVPAAEPEESPAEEPMAEVAEEPMVEEKDMGGEDPEKMMSKDSIHELVKRRVRLQTLAASAGIPAEVCDSADDDELARQFITARIPSAPVAKADSAQLQLLVETAALVPAATKNPFEVAREVKRDAADVGDDTIAKFMERQGYVH